MLLDATTASLLVIDVQDRLLPAMGEAEQVVKHCGLLLKAARVLDVPVTVSEQYPRGLGHTVPALKQDAGNAPVFEKLSFSCWRDPALKAHMVGHHEAGRPQVIVAGIEAHVCVLQSCIDLAMAGFGIFAVADAMSSRAEASVVMTHDRLRNAGVEVITTEMAIFELLGRAGTSEFKTLSALIR